MSRREKIIKFLDKNINIKMFGKDKEKFKKDFLNLIFDTKGEDFCNRTHIFINAILDEESLPYYIIVRETYELGNSKEYWTLVKYVL